MSAEGGLPGRSTRWPPSTGFLTLRQNILAHLDDIGGPNSFPHIPVGWALAGDTPFQWTKQVASHYGGTRNGMVISWPARIKDAGGIRSQWHHVVDITPTILAAAKLPQPKSVNGIKQKPMEGVSMVYSFADAKAPTTHTIQYFEMFGNRGIYRDGWTAVTRHSIPWDATSVPPKFTEDKWELYNTNDDFSQSQDLAAKYPDKLKDLQRVFLAEAEKYNVLPLDDRRVERFVPTVAGRPSTMWGRTSVTLYPGMVAMLENSDPRPQESFAHHRRGNRDTARKRARRNHRARRTFRRLESLRKGREAQILLTTGWTANTIPSSQRIPCPPVRSRLSFSSTMMGAVSEKAATGNSSSTVTRLPKAESSAPNRSSFQPMRLRMSARISERR